MSRETEKNKPEPMHRILTLRDHALFNVKLQNLVLFRKEKLKKVIFAEWKRMKERIQEFKNSRRASRELEGWWK